jgi:hypothetical protein
MIRKLWYRILLCCFLLFSGTAHAILITDRWPGDLNTIGSVSQDDFNHIFFWEENYSEDNLTHNQTGESHAVVNSPDEPGCPAGTQPCYFDKVLTLEGEEGIWDFQIAVINTSPFDWSGYIFEFYDPLFQQPLDNALLDVTSATFPVIEVMPNAVRLSGAKLTFIDLITLTADLDPSGGVGSIGIRQIATVPEPAILALLCLGFAGVGFSWRSIKT